MVPGEIPGRLYVRPVKHPRPASNNNGTAGALLLTPALPREATMSGTAPLKDIGEVRAETTALIHAAQEAGRQLVENQERWAEYWIRNEPPQEWDVWLQAWYWKKHARARPEA